MTTDGPMRIPMTATEIQDVLMTLTTGSGLIKSGQVEQISPLLQVSMIFSFEILSNNFKGICDRILMVFDLNMVFNISF